MKRVIAITAVLLAASAWAQTGGGYDLTWSTIDGGGYLVSTGGTYALGGTIGQPDAQPSPVMVGGAFELSGGFWPAANVCYCLADMTGDGTKDGGDIQLFVNCVLAGGTCACADVDQLNGLTVADVPVFVSMLLSDSGCP